jgi:hypothetical protein
MLFKGIQIKLRYVWDKDHITNSGLNILRKLTFTYTVMPADYSNCYGTIRLSSIPKFWAIISWKLYALLTKFIAHLSWEQIL